MKIILIVTSVLIIPFGLYTAKTLAKSQVTDSGQCQYASIACIKCMYADPHDPCHKSCPNEPHNPVS